MFCSVLLATDYFFAFINLLCFLQNLEPAPLNPNEGSPSKKFSSRLLFSPLFYTNLLTDMYMFVRCDISLFFYQLEVNMLVQVSLVLIIFCGETFFRK